jgi:hypothetical protein
MDNELKKRLEVLAAEALELDAPGVSPADCGIPSHFIWRFAALVAGEIVNDGAWSREIPNDVLKAIAADILAKFKP